MKRLLRLARESDFHKTEQELRNEKNSYISIWYGYNNYARDFQSIGNIAKEIRKEYPKLFARDMEIWYVEKSHSNMHAGHTFLRVSIPIEDFINLRNEGKLGIL